MNVLCISHAWKAPMGQFTLLTFAGFQKLEILFPKFQRDHAASLSVIAKSDGWGILQKIYLAHLSIPEHAEAQASGLE